MFIIEKFVRELPWAFLLLGMGLMVAMLLTDNRDEAVFCAKGAIGCLVLAVLSITHLCIFDWGVKIGEGRST